MHYSLSTLYALLICLCGAFVVVVDGQCRFSDGQRNDNIDRQRRLVCRPSVIDASFSVSTSTDDDSDLAGSVQSLLIECDNDADHAPASRLSNTTFASLIGRAGEVLTDVNVRGCRLTMVPAVFSRLTALQQLSVNTLSDGASDSHVQLASDALLPLAGSLRHLDLSRNGMWDLPGAALCVLRSLRSLNMSHNQLQELSDLGMAVGSVGDAGSCRLLELISVDLSYNGIATLPSSSTTTRSSTLSRWPALTELRLSHNQLELIEDGALDVSTSLQLIDLSNNRLVSVPSSLFKSCQRLSELRLANNSFSQLPAGLLSNLRQLLVLDLSGNQLGSVWLNSHTLAGLMRLVVLDLSANRLGQIESSMFTDLYSLQTLRLDGNQIDTLASHTFSSLPNLHTLSLRGNRLARVGMFSLAGLHALNTLSLGSNVLYEIELEAFSNASTLQQVDLSHNQFTLLPSEIRLLRLLKRLDLSHNRIISLESRSLLALRQLESLNIEGNLISNLSRDVFTGTAHMKTLNMANNQLRNIELGVFKPHMNLIDVRLEGNHLSDLGGVLVPLLKLRRVNISNNAIRSFDYAMVPPSLELIDLHGNQISALTDLYDKADSLRNLHAIDASFNRLKSLNSKNLPKSARVLKLNDNLINSVEHYTFFLLKQLQKVDLYANQITHMDLSALRLSSPNSSVAPPQFSLAGNPFVCDCTMEWLQRYNSLDKLHRYPRIVDLDSVYCRLIYHRQRGHVPLSEADTSMFLCPYKRHCFTTCHCCDFDACDCEMTCPDKCSCYHDQDWTSNIIDCSRSGFERIPDKLPMDATEVYLDGNNLQNISSLTFLGRKNMQSLFLNRSNIHVLENLTFAGLPNLKSLHLDGNNIVEFQGKEFEGLSQLRELHLQDNQISSIENTTFNVLQNLEVLRLDGNRISNFSAWELQKNPYLVEIAISRNLWSCACDFMKRFKLWLEKNSKKIDDYSSLTCWFDSEYEGPNIMNENETCFLLKKTTMVQRMIMSDYVPLVIATLVVMFLFVSLIIVMFVYRQELRLCLYSRCGFRLCYRSSLDSEQDRVFDAFVSYSEQDRSFVHHVLAPKLEQGEPPFRLALHYRDFPHSAYLADTIIEAVESSRRTIIVLSKNFIENEWCRFQFKSAHHEVLKDCRKRLIVVLLGELTYRELDPDLRLYLRTTGACISWDDKLFWEKLRLAMPPVSTTSSVQHSISHYSEIDENRYYRTRPATMDTLWG